MRRITFFVALGLLVTIAASGEPEDVLLGLRELAEQQPASGTAWARPLNGGSVRTLFIAPLFTLRDAAQLAQHVEMEMDLAPVWDAERLGLDEVEGARAGIEGGNPWAAVCATREEVLERLQKRLERQHDLVIVANVDLAILPETVITLLAENVRAGMGLLVVGCRGGKGETAKKETSPATRLLESLEPVAVPDALTRGVGEQLTPEWSKGLGFLKTAQLGEGRVVLFEYPSERPYTQCLLPDLSAPIEALPEFLDVYFSLVAKAVQWSIHREPPLWVEQVEYSGPRAPDESELPAELPDVVLEKLRSAIEYHPHLPYTVRFNQPAERPYQVRSRVRQPGRASQLTLNYKRPLAKGAATYPVYVPAGPGESFLDVWLLDKDDVVGWSTQIVRIDAWPDFEDLVFSKTALRSNDTLDISFTVTPDPSRPRVVTALARGLDSLNRLVAQTTQAVPVEGGNVVMRLEFVDLIASEVKVEVYLADIDSPNPSEWVLGRAAYRNLYLPVRHAAGPSGIRLLAEFEGFAEYNARSFVDSIRSAGIDIGYTSACRDSAFYFPSLNMSVLPEVGSCAARRSDGLVRSPCLSDSGFRNAEKKRIEAAVKDVLELAPRHYSLGCGERLAPDKTNLCQSPSCLAMYRAALEVQYGDLSTLNAAWGTQFDSWDDVLPAPEDVASQLRAYAPWVDFRRCMDAVFCDMQVFGRNAVRGVDSKSSVGFAASADSDVYTGYDWAQLAPRLEFLAAPPDLCSVENVRCLRKPGALTSVVLPPGVQGGRTAYARWFPWFTVLHGSSVVWGGNAYGGSIAVSPSVAIVPDGRAQAGFAALAAETDALKAGIGEVLLSGTRLPCGVAVYASQSSRYVNHVETSFGCVDSLSETMFMRLLGSMGYVYDVVSSAQALRGELAKYRLVVLPMARALSDAEVDALREFRAAGGCLIADLAPAKFDEHGVARTQPALADVFGVTHDGPGTPGSAASTSIRWESGEEVVDATLADVVADGSTKAADAAHLGMVGETPIWLVHSGGGGLAVLLNHPIARGASLGDWSNTKGLRTGLAGVLSQAGIEPVAEIESKKQHGFQGECVGYEYGRARILALLTAPDAAEETQKVQVRLKESEYVYDSRLGVRLSRGHNASLLLKPGDAAVLAALPYEVNALQLAVPRNVLPGHRLLIDVELDTKGESPGKHVVHVEFGPNIGAPLRHYARDIVCEGGIGTAYIPLALNEKVGIYKVVARDALTGISAQALVGVGANAWKGTLMAVPASP